MTDRLDLDGRVSRWLTAEAPARAPERLIHATRERVAATPQIGGIFGLGRQLPSLALRPTVVAAMLLAAVVVVIGLMNGRPPSIGSRQPVTSASPTPSRPSPSTSACPAGQGTCLEALQPGAYFSTSFVPNVSYTVPSGWIKTLDVRGELDLQFAAGGSYTYPDGLTFHDAISFFRRPVAESATSEAPEKGVGKTAKALGQWLDTHVDLNATGLTPITIGGSSGYRIELSLPAGPRKRPDHCTTDHGEPRCESLFISDDPAATYGFGLVGPESAVVYLFDTPSGDTVMVVIDDVDGVDQAGLVADATPIVSSVVFGP